MVFLDKNPQKFNKNRGAPKAFCPILSKKTEKTAPDGTAMAPGKKVNEDTHHVETVRPLDGRTRTAKRVNELKHLLAGAMRRGGWKMLGPLQKLAVEKTARRIVMAEIAQDRFFAGSPNITATDVVRATNAADRALRELKLPTEPEAPMSLRDQIMGAKDVS